MYSILDEAYVCHLGFTVGETPRMIPTIFVRIADTLYVHGGTGSGPMLALRHGGPVAVSISLLDGLIFGRSQFHHSVRYRSVLVHSTARPVTDPDTKRQVLTAMVEKLAVGRAADSRPPSGKELAATGVLAIDLTGASVKTREGGPLDEPEDLDLPHWAGTIPLRLVPGVPEPDAGVAAPVPAYLRPARSPWLEPVRMVGQHVVLEPLDHCHAEALFVALDDPQVHRHIIRPTPRDPAHMADLIDGLLAEAHAGNRVPWVQRDAVTGEVVGTTAYCPVDEHHRSVHIGMTQLGRKWWRTGINTEAKLLLMTRAFEELGAVRVEFQTDIRNTRSQAAIERLGAQREGVLRKHKRRMDGSWRDSVFYGIVAEEWPQIKTWLTDRLADQQR